MGEQENKEDNYQSELAEVKKKLSLEIAAKAKLNDEVEALRTKLSSFEKQKR